MLNVILAAGALALAGSSPRADATGTGLESGSETWNETLDAAATTAFKVARLHLGDGRVVEDGVVVVEKGVIRRVGKGIEIPAGAAVIEHDGDLSPGLVALHSYDGGGGDLFDSTRPVLPAASVVHAFDPGHSDFERSRAAGITAVVLAPSGSALCPGTTAVVKTSGGKVLNPRAHLVLGLSRRALRGNEYPTSYGAALAELGRHFDAAEGNFGRAASGNLPVLLEVGDRAEIARALDFAAQHKLQGALYGSLWCEELADRIAKSGLAVVCDAADAGLEERAQRSVVALAAAGVRFGFGLDAPMRSPDSLRFAAALAIREGLEPAQALRALTSDAARIAGVGGRVGTIAAGLDADLVLWSGPPTDLGSRVVAVYVDGKRVEGGE